MSNPLIGQALDRYQILSELGQGEQGVVYKAHDPLLERAVALKVIELRRIGPPEAVERLLDRARTAARLDHPGLVKVHDFGRNNTLLYIIMEYIPGGSLRALLHELRDANQWVLLSEAVQLVRHLALVLDYINRQGAPPRRVRPADILFKPDPADGLPYRPVLTDLGLEDAVPTAPLAGDSPSAGYAYWSPEQTVGQPITERSQVYSLGVLLYELAVGWLPFPVQTLAEAVHAHTRAEPPAPRVRRADLPLPLEGVILRALAKAPEHRYAGPAELAQALAEVLPAVEQAEAVPEAGAWAVSLLVPYQRSLRDEQTAPAEERWPVPPAPPTLGEAPETMNLAQGRLRVVALDGRSRYVMLPARGLTLGRSPDNDLALDDPAVAPFHARVDWRDGQYKIVDLNSPSGTFVSGLRLLPGMPEPWLPETPVLVGNTWLHLEPAAIVARPSVFRFDGMVVDASLVQTSPGGRVGVYVEIPQLTVTPGQRTTAAVVIINNGPDIDRLSLSLEGLPANWIVPPGPTSSVQLPPGGHQRLKVAVEPPRSPTSRAGRYTLTMRVASQAQPNEAVEAKIAVSVAAFAQFHVELNAQTGRSNDIWRLSVHNQGNTHEGYTVTFEDPEDELTIDPPAATLPVPEGHVGVLDFASALQRPRLIGGRRAHPFAVRVAASNGQAQKLSAEVISSALVPAWVPLLLLFIGCLLLGAAAYAYTTSASSAAATSTAASRQTAQAFANADVDNDGLSNVDEVRLGTDPVNPDTDADGLLDGEEGVWGSNPRVPDTDGDTLLDGREVKELQSSPINPDTDGDGLQDNVDPDPGHQPTPTASPTATGTATATLPPATPSETASPVTATPTLTLAPPTATLPVVTPSATVVVVPSADPAGGILIFEARRDGNPELYIMASNGAGQARLTNNPGTDTSPVWSATRQRLAFQTDRDGNQEIYTMAADGAGATRLTNNGAADTDPAWSPDGNRIAFVSNRDGNAEIYLMNVDGAELVRVTNNAAADTDPAWSPDGTRVLFVSERDGNRELYVINLDGSGLTNLTNNGASDNAPAWAPNGAFIAFVSNRDGNDELYLMNADGSAQLRLTNNSGADTLPTWSPNTARLAFVREHEGNGEIYVMNADGSGEARLTTSAGLDTSPVWAPDGNRLAFRSERDANAEVYVVNLDGTGLARLTNDPTYDSPWVWRP